MATADMASPGEAARARLALGTGQIAITPAARLGAADAEWFCLIAFDLADSIRRVRVLASETHAHEINKALLGIAMACSPGVPSHSLACYTPRPDLLIWNPLPRGETSILVLLGHLSQNSTHPPSCYPFRKIFLIRSS